MYPLWLMTHSEKIFFSLLSVFFVSIIANIFVIVTFSTRKIKILNICVSYTVLVVMFIYLILIIIRRELNE